jgi:Ca-activated chloride channel family protein
MAVDTSLSMDATDVKPTRLRAAKEGAATFVDSVPAGVQVGLIGFSGTIRVLADPTTDHAALKRAVDRLTLGPGTAIGDAIFACLDTIFAAAGDHRSGDARIVLMSDGATTVGRPNSEAAHAAADAHVPVSTIAYGTDEGVLDYQGQLVPVPVDKAALSDIATATGGRFFEAASAEAIKHVYAGLGSSISHVTRRRELTTWFVGLGLSLIVVAAAGSLLWSPRMP